MTAGLAALVALTAKQAGPAQDLAAGYGQAYAAIAVPLVAVALLAVALRRRHATSPAAPATADPAVPTREQIGGEVGDQRFSCSMRSQNDL
ncbi:hypothetical protein [Spongiactinospora sp. TRM90649]|uniref:hypothetical protein n=1 Tax=Spongiactinospora sp. TRM90649 TaxID=3031114 RepID=UPI0023F90642|nr:hypothetical protein [Spongiactinospora sp. TRM90649]MDF5755141.1 hypothetical protein [Spongiactinospora sp. TRM90649]